MISVPQLLAAIMGVGVALGAGGAMLVMSSTRKKRSARCGDHEDVLEGRCLCGGWEGRVWRRS
eukprot:28412-Hanusia_phi.AAC.17